MKMKTLTILICSLAVSQLVHAVDFKCTNQKNSMETCSAFLDQSLQQESLELTCHLTNFDLNRKISCETYHGFGNNKDRSIYICSSNTTNSLVTFSGALPTQDDIETPYIASIKIVFSKEEKKVFVCHRNI